MLEKLPEFVGHALRDTRAGLDQVLGRRLPATAGTAAITVTSADFTDHAPLPADCTADGPGRSPALSWTGVPEGTSSLVLVVEDADSPTPHPLVHALVVDLPARDGALEAKALDDELSLPPPGRLGRNSYLQAKWLPPDPPRGHGPHRYVFQVFAMSAGPAFDEHAGREAVFEAIEQRAIASGTLIGTYERPDGTVKAGEGAGTEPGSSPLAAA